MKEKKHEKKRERKKLIDREKALGRKIYCLRQTETSWKLGEI